MTLAFVGFLWGVSAAATAEGSALQRFESSQLSMGTLVEVVLYAPDQSSANGAFRAAFERIAQVDRVMSDYDPESELMRLCRQAPTAAPVPVSDDLCRVLTAAQDLSRRTDGVFDVTVGNLTKLWRRARRQHELPDAELLRAARETTGFRNLVVDPERATVELKRPGMRLDLGAIAKGYAADTALAVLRGLGIPRAMINVGGEVCVLDPPPDRPAWRIGIASLEENQPPSVFLEIANACVATSGDTWQYVEIGGVRYSHILDPRTGVGLTQRSSVSVIAPTGMAADGLATAVSVLGVDAGLRLIEETPGAAALILRRENGRIAAYRSSRFAQYERP